MKKYFIKLLIFILSISIICITSNAETIYQKGDMNHNNKIDLKDIIILIKDYLKIEDTTEEDIIIGDMNNNGKIDLKDIILLIKKYLNIDNSESNKNLTRLYFSSKMRRTTSGADCTLIENFDNNGNSRFALVDTGYATSEQEEDDLIVEFLNEHNVEKLDFILLTHWHTDHVGNILPVLQNFEVDTIYMQEFDDIWGNGRQDLYNKTIELAFDKGIKVVGVNYNSLISEKISPNLGTTLRNKLKSATDEQKNKFIGFNENNTSFTFGSSSIQLFNYELFTNDGKIFNPSDVDNNPREVVGPNNNSVCLLLTQGNKKVFLTGDLNNLDANEETGRIGDEDRIKDLVGKVDILKLGHHGYANSNTPDFLDTLAPKYAVITTKIDGANAQTIEYLKNNGIEYLYVSIDKEGIVATLTNNDCWFSYETKSLYKRVDNKTYYIPDKYKYDNFNEHLYELEYDEIDYYEANSWSSLKEIIDDDKENIPYNCDESLKKCKLKKIDINLKDGDWNARELIEIEKQQYITLHSEENINILKTNELKDSNLFYIEGTLIIGNNEMNGTISIDGNGNAQLTTIDNKTNGECSNISSTNPLIYMYYGNLTLNSNSQIVNNCIEKQNNNIVKNSNKHAAIISGAAIYASQSSIVINGGSVKNNTGILNIDYKLASSTKVDYRFNISGIGISLVKSNLHILSGEISNNTGINNSKVNSGEKGLIVNNKGTLYQNIAGGGIHAENNSSIILDGGNIVDNKLINNSITNLETGSSYSERTEVTSIYHDIAGSGINIRNSSIEAKANATIGRNEAINNIAVRLGKNAFVNTNFNTKITGGQIFVDNDNNIDKKIILTGTKILKGTIQDNANINIENTENTSTPVYESMGGLIYFFQTLDFKIKDISFNNANAYYGGAIYLNSSSGTISSSMLKENIAEKSGGAIYMKGKSNIEFKNNIIQNNLAKYSGGGICSSSSTLNMSGNTVEYNTAKNNGGGIYVSGENFTFTDGIIRNNIAEKNGNQIYPTKWENIFIEN